MATSLRTDIHLNQLYLKWASDFFRSGNAEEGKSFFRFASRRSPCETECKVYKQMWKIKNRPEGDPELGRKTFHEGGFSSTLEEKSQAIDRVLRRVDRNELAMQENQVLKNLWIAHGSPRFDLEYGRHAFFNTHGQSASFAEKVIAARHYAEDSRICRFEINHFIIDIVKRENGRLKWLLHPRNSELLRYFPLERGDQNIERLIDKVQKNFIVGEYEGSPFIYDNFQRYPYFPTFTFSGNKEFNLLQSPDGSCIWRAFDPGTMRASWIWPSEADTQIINYLIVGITRRFAKIRYARRFTAKATWLEGSKIASVSLIHPSQMDRTQSIDSENSGRYCNLWG